MIKFDNAAADIQLWIWIKHLTACIQGQGSVGVVQLEAEGWSPATFW